MRATRVQGRAKAPYDFDLRRFGTFRPFLRASERPIAIACLRLVTFFPLRPLRSVARLRLRIARATSLEALREYRRAIVLFPWIVFSYVFVGWAISASHARLRRAMGTTRESA